LSCCLDIKHKTVTTHVVASEINMTHTQHIHPPLPYTGYLGVTEMGVTERLNNLRYRFKDLCRISMKYSMPCRSNKNPIE